MFFILLSIFLFLMKMSRFFYLLLGLELLLLGLILKLMFLGKFNYFFIMMFLGVVSSITCLVLFLILIKFFGKDFVNF